MESLKNNILGFVIGAIFFGGISTVVATTILSSSVSYTNNNQTTVEGALDELYGMVNIACYNGVCGKLSYRYWNDDFEYSDDYASNEMPTTNYLKSSDLETAYGSSNFADSPVYVRSILIDENVVGHQACLWNNNKEFCFGPGYWAGTLNTASATAGTQTKLKLQRDMQNALGITIQDCSSGTDYTECYIGDFECVANSNGNVYCYSDVTYVGCLVHGDGSTYCG